MNNKYLLQFIVVSSILTIVLNICTAINLRVNAQETSDLQTKEETSDLMLSLPVIDKNLEQKIATSTFSTIEEKEKAVRELKNNSEITTRLDQIIYLLKQINRKTQ